jgi:hypothetical protein
MSSFDRHQELNTKKIVDATPSNVLQPTVRDELEETFINSLTPVMLNQLETCRSM